MSAESRRAKLDTVQKVLSSCGHEGDLDATYDLDSIQVEVGLAPRWPHRHTDNAARGRVLERES